MAWLVMNLVTDRPLTPEAAAFFKSSPLQVEDNLYIAMAGLFAPSGTQDLYAYGKEGIDLSDEELEERAPLRFKGNKEKACLARQSYSIGECLSADDLEGSLSENEELLDRYMRFVRGSYKTASFGDRLVVQGIYGTDIIALNTLLVEKWSMQAQTGKAESALQEWLAGMSSIREIVQGEMGFPSHAVWMIIYSRNLSVLPVLLGNAPGLITRYKRQLVDTLNDDYMDLWNVEGMIRVEGNILSMIEESQKVISQGRAGLLDKVEYKENETKNKFYAALQDMVRLSTLPADRMVDSYRRSHKAYSCDGWRLYTCFLYNPVANIVISSVHRGVDIFVMGRKNTVRHRALLLWMEAKEQGVPVEEISLFVKSVSPEFYNPATKKPFIWNSEANAITYEWGGQETVAVYYNR